jgi:hypothetical protein
VHQPSSRAFIVGQKVEFVCACKMFSSAYLFLTFCHHGISVRTNMISRAVVSACVVVVTLTACGSGGESGTTAPKPDISPNTLTARIGDVPFTASSLAARADGRGYFVIRGSSGDTSIVELLLSGIVKPGTYPLGVSRDLAGGFTRNWAREPTSSAPSPAAPQRMLRNPLILPLQLIDLVVNTPTTHAPPSDKTLIQRPSPDP